MVIGLLIVLVGIALIPFIVVSFKNDIEELYQMKELTLSKKVIIFMGALFDMLTFNNYTSILFFLSTLCIIGGSVFIIYFLLF